MTVTQPPISTRRSIARVTASGELDTSFTIGYGGYGYILAGPSRSSPAAGGGLAIDDGALLVAGWGADSPQDFSLTRLDESGGYWSTTWTLTPDFASSIDYAYGLAMRSDGTAMVVGATGSDFGALCVKQPSGLEERIYPLFDANYNVTTLISATAQTLERFEEDPQGKFTVLNGDYSVDVDGSDFGWVNVHQGGRFDAVVNGIEFRHRWLSVELLVWMSQDPIGFRDGMNRYQPYRGNPARFIDPSGLVGEPVYLEPPERGAMIGQYRGGGLNDGAPIYPELKNGEPTGHYYMYNAADQFWQRVDPSNISDRLGVQVLTNKTEDKEGSVRLWQRVRWTLPPTANGEIVQEVRTYELECFDDGQLNLSSYVYYESWNVTNGEIYFRHFTLGKVSNDTDVFYNQIQTGKKKFLIMKIGTAQFIPSAAVGSEPIINEYKAARAAGNMPNTLKRPVEFTGNGNVARHWVLYTYAWKGAGTKFYDWHCGTGIPGIGKKGISESKNAKRDR